MNRTILILTFVLAVAENSRAQSTFFFANLSGDQVSPPFGVEGDPSGSPFTGTVAMEFTPAGVGASPTLSYVLSVPGMDLDGSLTPATLSDDVTAIHIHFGAPGANGPHGLNILGLSGGQIREDDADMSIDVVNHTVSGIWDNSDESLTGAGGTRLPPDTVALEDAVTELFAGELYFQLHTLNFPSGELRGQIVMVPEPGIPMLLLLGGGSLFLIRRRR